MLMWLHMIRFRILNDFYPPPPLFFTRWGSIVLLNRAHKFTCNKTHTNECNRMKAHGKSALNLLLRLYKWIPTSFCYVTHSFCSHEIQKWTTECDVQKFLSIELNVISSEFCLRSLITVNVTILRIWWQALIYELYFVSHSAFSCPFQSNITLFSSKTVLLLISH